MKIPKKYRGNQGLGLLAAVILFVLFIVFIGTLTYIVWKAIKKLPHRPPPAEEEVYIQQAIQNETSIIQSNNPGSIVSVQALAVAYSPVVKVFIPFGPVDVVSNIERSTNLINWEFLMTVGVNNTFIDTNPPPDRAFYRRFDLQGNTIEVNTNHAPGFYYVPKN